MGANENRVHLYTNNGIMRDERKEGTFIYIQRIHKVLQWANTTNIGGLIIQGLFMNSQKRNNNSRNDVITALPHLRVKT